ncbi:PRC-barrel-like protein [Corchorus capsularis]|uniref:PRC-barrel-like protein n=1 Tax=Corchorus capsularis TaxID=210143 RepID=A0A1R3G740_COCAP|nr:PRC-barrel-like protein [Corchorus capsularis]
MCNCIIWSPPSPLPFSSSIIRLGNSTLSNSQIPATHFPIIRNNGRLQLIQCTMKPKSGPEAEGSGELKFEDKGSDDLELKRLRTDASLEKIGDKEEFGSESEKGSGESRDELVKMESRKKRQLMKRSNMVAKQVISIQSAQSLGFVSQLWVDTTSWLVLVVEVRPSLLAGESERFLLQDINKVGDVVLVEDESVMENEFKMIRLDTLVGYRVVTPGNQNIGKVRGYTFNINSGAVESLELDSFGISIIPSSLVTTYALLVEDVLEVIADTVIVHEAAASRIQRLTKGFWDDQNAGISIDDDTEYVDERPARSNTRRGSRGRKSRSKMRDADDDWELPMDYL